MNSAALIESKKKDLWVELKRMYEPDPSDKYWKFSAHDRHTTWKMYENGVDHVSTQE